MAELLIMGSVRGVESTKITLANMPVSIRNEVFQWLKGENAKFIGTFAKPGLIKQFLLEKQSWRTGGTWQRNVVNLFKGFIIDPVNGRYISVASEKLGGGAGVAFTGISMTLQMGVPYKDEKKIHQAMEMLETGGTYSSDKFMPILFKPQENPNIKNPAKTFQIFMQQKMFFTVYKNGLAYYFLKGDKNYPSKLMYIGTKKITVRWHHDFLDKFNAEEPAIIQRGNEAVEKAVKEL